MCMSQFLLEIMAVYDDHRHVIPVVWANHGTLVMMLIGLVWATGTVSSCACIGTIICPYQGMHPVCWSTHPPFKPICACTSGDGAMDFGRCKDAVIWWQDVA